MYRVIRCVFHMSSMSLLNKSYPLMQTSLLIEHLPQADRQYTHYIERRYLRTNHKNNHAKRVYLSDDDYEALSTAEKIQTVIERYAFTLHPLLRDEYFEDLSLSDIEQTIKSAPDREVWLLMLIENQLIRHSALKPFNDSWTDMIESSGKTIALKKLLELYGKKAYSQMYPFQSAISRCIVAVKDEVHVGPMAVYKISDIDVHQLLCDTLGTSYDQQKLITSINTRSFLNSFKFRNWDIVPFELVKREICMNGKKEKRGTDMVVMHVMCIIPEEMYNAQFGAPINLLEEPFQFHLKSQPETIYNDYNNLGFYFVHPLFDSLYVSDKIKS